MIQLVELVGLTYEQFTRTVLLAQNDFATFLKSKGSAKAELLEKLTGTGVYSRISQEVYARNKAAQEEVTLIQNRMNVIELMPEEELLALQKEKELSAEKRVIGIKLLAEQNEQAECGSFIKNAGRSLEEEATGRTGGAGQIESVTGRIGFTRRRIGAFQGTMGSHTAGLEESPSVGCTDTVTAGQLHTIETDVTVR